MTSVTSLTDLVHQRLANALTATLPEADADPLLRRSDRADFQANGILALAKKAKANPRELATQVVANVTTGDVIKDIEVSGPGFLNVTITDRAITETLAAWQKFVDESKIYFFSVFEKLDMEIRDADIVGESGYNDMLDETCRLLEESGVAEISDGALCVFFDDIKGPDGNRVPLIVRKSDGGYGYAATDLSAIRDRVFNLKATNLLYVVDVRQSLHFKMVFETARRAGWLNDDVTAYQLAFGTILGKDGKPFKTREGVSVKLEDLLDEAVQRATAVVRDKAEKVGLTEQEIVDNGRYVGIGAVKYADLSTSAVRDYKFDLDQMVSLHGDTSVYLQYAYARIQSILRKAGEARPAAHPELELAPAERALGLHLDQFSEVVSEAAKEYAPHKLTAYLYQLASALTTFYDQCHVLSPDNAPEVVENRLFLVDLTARTLQRGMALLGIRTPEKL